MKGVLTATAIRKAAHKLKTAGVRPIHTVRGDFYVLRADPAQVRAYFISQNVFKTDWRLHSRQFMEQAWAESRGLA